MSELLRKRDVVKQFGVASRTLDDWIRRKLIPHIKFGKLIRFRQEDVERFIESYRVKALHERSLKKLIFRS